MGVIQVNVQNHGCDTGKQTKPWGDTGKQTKPWA